MVSESKCTSEVGGSHGFKLLSSQPLAEIDGAAHVFVHEKSGARLLYLENDDNNKGFSITFKTPASDDTGVFHILEHSVLCGSRKFPVKEPFVNLLKSSMQTFLNAMTFPDKTMYPVASTNERDLLNLADVYMDAVFHPNIYRNRRIFEQEGWHYEFDADEGAALVYNGVVFNEMKGALSDPDAVLFDTLSAALFPDTTYRFESGGTPEGIPTLTYRQFLDNHARHYRTDNSYIVLYGNLDLDVFLGFLDEEYLTPLAEGDCEKAPGEDAPGPRAPHEVASCEDASVEGTPNVIALQSPVVAEGVKRTMATPPENSCAALGYVVGDSTQRERMIAVSVLVDAIMGSNEAPLKRAILDAGMADDCDGYLADSVAQPFVAITARGLHGENAADELRDLVASEAKRLADGALDIDVVEAALSHAEFTLREGSYGYADGVVMSMASMNGWLYSDTPEAATAYIRYEDALADLRGKLETDFFHDLLRQVFCENDHRAQVEIVPTDQDEEKLEIAKLAEVQSGMTPAQLASIEEEVAALREAQTKPDSAEDLARLPKLSRKDIGCAPDEPACEMTREGSLDVLRHEVETRGIVYATKYFSLASVSLEELPYVSILAITLGKLDTASHTASQINTLVQSRLGSFGLASEVFETDNLNDGFDVRFTVAASALSCNAEYAASIVNEVLLTTDFSDSDKIRNILVQQKIGMEQRFAMAGNSVACARASSYILPAWALREHIGGIEFYVFLKRLIDNYEAEAQPLVDRLNDLARRIFIDDGCLLSFAGTDDDFKAYIEAGALLGASKDVRKPALKALKPENLQEAFIVPTDVTYSALIANRRALGGSLAKCSEYSGAWMVASRILSYDYLWNEVRVMGGAYGVGFSATRTGISSFSSFRDPHVSETLGRFEGSGAWLARFQPSEDEFEGYVVSTAASFDKPMKPRELVRRQATMHLKGFSREEYMRYRSEVVEASLEQVKSLAPAIDELCATGCICVVGNRDIIQQSGVKATIVDLLAL